MCLIRTACAANTHSITARERDYMTSRISHLFPSLANTYIRSQLAQGEASTSLILQGKVREMLSARVHEEQRLYQRLALDDEQSLYQRLTPAVRQMKGENPWLVLTSDWHLEPWFDTSDNRGRNAGGDKRVSRFDDSDVQQKWSCRACHDCTEPVQCTVTGKNDPPINLIESHLEVGLLLLPHPASASLIYRLHNFFFLSLFDKL